ncbi:MAG: thioredoxin family protein [Candidatus Babeliales bacterium]|nr:thioredoxin family protein [Candidatus Babeliales bacterium]
MKTKLIYSILLLASFNTYGIVKQYTNESDIAKDKVAVVKCFANWCGACKAFAQPYETLANENANDATFYEVDADTPAGKEFSGKYQVPGFPTMVVFNLGKPVGEKIVGGNQDLIKERIKEAKNTPVEKSAAQVSVAKKECGITQEATSSAYFKKPGIVVVKFYGDSCQFCGPYAKNFEEVAQEYSSFATFFQVDVDKYPDIKIEYNVDGLPRTLVLDSGKVVDTVRGDNADKLRRTLKALKNGTPIYQSKVTIEDGDKPARVRQVTKKQVRKPVKNRKPTKRKRVVEVEEYEELED